MASTRPATDLRARDVMTADVLSAHPEWSIEHLANFFIENDISGAPVTDDEGRLRGVVSMTDITMHSGVAGETTPRPKSHKRYHLALEGEYSDEDLKAMRSEAWTTASVADIMTPMVFDVSENAPVQDVADTMIRGRIHRVLVTRDSELVGIITALDLLEVVRDL